MALTHARRPYLHAVYRAIHAAGVVHRDIAIRHVLRAPGKGPYKYWLIDWEGAVVPEPADRAALTGQEQLRLHKLLTESD